MASTSTTIPGTAFRAGYVAKGVVNLLIGVLAVLVVNGTGTAAAGALEQVGGQPHGQFLLVLLALGVLGVAMWRFVEGFLEARDRGTDLGGAFARLGVVVSSLLYTVIGILAIRYATSAGGGAKQEATAWLMARPGGVWVVGLLGVIGLVFGLHHLRQAYDGPVTKHFARQDLTETLLAVVRFGIAARGVALCVIGALIVQAAATHHPSDVGGLDRALQTLAAQSFGPSLLALIAIGLVSYGVHCFSVAAYGRFPDVEISGGHVRQLRSDPAH
jgi:hypothetical protein